MLISKKYGNGYAISIVIIIGLFILLYNLQDPSPGILRKTSLEIVSSLEAVINMPLKGLRDVWVRYILLVGLEADNRRLKEKNSLLIGELVKYREGYLEGIRLQEILKLQEGMPYYTLAAKVVGRNPSSVFKMILINRGEADGLRAGLPVVAVPGLLGRVMESSWNVSRVLLIQDENSNIDAMVQETRVQGMLQGAASAGCNLKYVSKTASVKVGDIVITSGLGGIFPKGLPIGVVKAASKKEADLFQRIEVKPFTDPDGIEEVLVIISDKGDKK